MKQFLKNLSFVALVSFALASCQKEAGFDQDANDNGTNGGSLTAVIDGVPFTSAPQQAQAAIVSGQIAIQAINAKGNYIGIIVPDLGVHTYQLSYTTLSLANVKDNATSMTEEGWVTGSLDNSDSVFGELNITAIDVTKKVITGTFFFDAINENTNTKRHVTEGKFNLSYVTTVTQTPSSSTDTLRAKVNGNAFTATSVLVLNAFGRLTVGGTTGANGAGISINFETSLQPGSYPLDIAGTTVAYSPASGAGNSLVSFSGTLVILENDAASHRVRGTFAMDGQNLQDASIKGTITEGYFSIKYQ